MGTSTSHPSPNSSEWKNVKTSIISGDNPKGIINNIIDAYYSEYDASTMSFLVDDGVVKVAKLLQTSFETIEKRDNKAVAKFIGIARRELALNQINSFFAELSITAATKVILGKETNTSRSFAIQYSTILMQYVISRDLPNNFGTLGIVNFKSKDQLFESISKEFESRVRKLKHSDSIKILKKILASQKGR